jgi:hypothetical protein
MFLTFRDARIVSQANYGCYPPLEPQVQPSFSLTKTALWRFFLN